jgi:hypothetical protein
MHNLMDALVRNAELPGEVGLRDASRVSGANEGVAFLRAEGWIRLRGILVDEIQGGGDQIRPIL